MADGWEFELRSDLEKLGILPERKFNRAMKVVLKKGLEWCKAAFMQKHFSSSAYGAYHEVYARLKIKFRKHKYTAFGGVAREPLVLTGNLRRHMLYGGQQITGTSTQAKMRIKYGRPPITEEKKEKEIRILIAQSIKNGKPITYKEAESQFYSNWGYGRRNRELFQEAISATNAKEIREICEFSRAEYLKLAKSLGERKRVRIKG